MSGVNIPSPRGRAGVDRDRDSPTLVCQSIGLCEGSFIPGNTNAAKKLSRNPSSPLLSKKLRETTFPENPPIIRSLDTTARSPSPTLPRVNKTSLCPTCSRASRDFVVCCVCGQLGCFFCSNPPKCTSCRENNNLHQSPYTRINIGAPSPRSRPSPKGQRHQSPLPLRDSPRSQKFNLPPSPSSPTYPTSTARPILNPSYSLSQLSPEKTNQPAKIARTESYEDSPPIATLGGRTSPTFAGPCRWQTSNSIPHSRRTSQSRSVSPSRSYLSAKSSNRPPSPILEFSRPRGSFAPPPEGETKVIIPSFSQLHSPPFGAVPETNREPPGKSFESHQNICTKVQSTIQGIKDDEDELERLKKQMEKIEASMMKKEAELSQLEWKSECSRVSKRDQEEVTETVGKGWSATEYESLKKTLDSIKSLFTNAQQSTCAETKEEVQERDITIQTAFKSLASLSASAFEISKIAPKFDVCPQLKGNGWRSFLTVLESCLHALLSHLKKLDKRWWRTIKRTSTCVKYIETWDSISCLAVENLLENSPPGCLFPFENFEGVLSDSLSLPLEVFYGKFFGVHFEKGLRRILGLLLVAMASFGDGVKSGEGVRGRFRALMTSTKYLAFNKKAAERTVQLFGSGDINFLKAFWGLQETVSFVELDTAIRTPSPSLNMTFKIKVGTLMVPAKNWPEMVRIDVEELFEEHNEEHHSKKHYDQQEARNHREKSLSKSGKGTDSMTVQYDFDRELKRGTFSSVQVRIISYCRHKGQLNAHGYEKAGKAHGTSRSLGDLPEEEGKGKGIIGDENWVAPMASGLLIHIHGGGFVAQTSKAHLNYLRDYAKAIDAPIFSIDYSLSPENPFPQPVYETFYAYCWALCHTNLLGTRADRIVITGDSAGGNLIIAVTILAIKMGVRVPDVVVPIYPALLAKRIPSPARILSMMDPVLGTGVLLQCLHCYSAGLEVVDPLLSPVFCSDEILKQFPPVQLITGKLDPLLDDCIHFVSHLKRLEKPTILQLLDGLPHGFLGFNRVCSEATNGTKVVIDHLRFAFQLTRFPPYPSILDLEKNPELMDPDPSDLGPETPDKPGPIVIIQVMRGESDSVGYLQVKETSVFVSPKKFFDREDKSFLFRVHQRRCKNLGNESLLFSTGVKSLKKQKFISQSLGKITLSETFTETEFIDIRSPVWKMTKHGTEIHFYESLHILTVGITDEPLNFELVPYETMTSNSSK